MTSLTIRNLEPETKDELRRRAAAHGRSMQDEARTILRGVLNGSEPSDDTDLYTYVRSLVEPIGGVDDLDIPMRQIGRDPPSFDDF